jgi:hypothetical protein
LRRVVRHAVGRPVLALERIDAGGDVAVDKEQAKRGFRREADVSVNPEQMGVAAAGQEIGHAIVAHPRNQAVARTEIEVERHASRRRLALKVDYTEHVVEAELLAEARRHDQRPEIWQNRVIEHQVAPVESGQVPC